MCDIFLGVAFLVRKLNPWDLRKKSVPHAKNLFGILNVFWNDLGYATFKPQIWGMMCGNAERKVENHCLKSRSLT